MILQCPESRQLTLEEFRDTLQWCDDLTLHVDGIPQIDASHKPQGNLYLDCVYIERVTDAWPQSVRAYGAWSLVIGNCERVTDDLESLERDLYAFACSEGYCDD